MARRRALKDRPYADPIKTERARAPRRAMTPAEARLWGVLRDGALGVRVRTQHVICGWIVDFYIPAARLVIEVDGDVHDHQGDEDERRSAALRAEGLEVLRVRNEAIFATLADVFLRIAAVVRARTAPPPSGPPASP